MPGKASSTQSAATRSATMGARAKKGSRSGRRTASAAARPVDALRLLKDDHREVKDWFAQFDKTEDGAAKQDLAHRICKALSVHMQIEEELFYPAAYAALDEDGDDLVDEAVVEHASAKALVGEIKAMKVGEPLFDAKVKVLGEYVEHHIKEEEGELFADCRDAGMDLKKLGATMGARKAELMTKG